MADADIASELWRQHMNARNYDLDGDFRNCIGSVDHLRARIAATAVSRANRARQPTAAPITHACVGSAESMQRRKTESVGEKHADPHQHLCFRCFRCFQWLCKQHSH